jgi:hypothetical protein
LQRAVLTSCHFMQVRVRRLSWLSCMSCHPCCPSGPAPSAVASSVDIPVCSGFCLSGWYILDNSRKHVSTLPQLHQILNLKSSGITILLCCLNTKSHPFICMPHPHFYISLSGLVCVPSTHYWQWPTFFQLICSSTIFSQASFFSSDFPSVFFLSQGHSSTF